MVRSVSRRSALFAIGSLTALAAAIVAFRIAAPPAGRAPADDVPTTTDAPLAFVGSDACAGCHATQYAAWRGSHHHRAMEDASERSVLGDFEDAEVRYFGRVTRFSRQNERFVVTTENGDGRLETFTVGYTLGVYPLQQYLVAFDDGRIQALPFAWDARPQAEGGQRWFHLYPDDDVRPEDPLFWTRPLQNWNHMCGDCHTTDFSKGFSNTSERFESRFSELGNGCESCHGPGSAHVRAPSATEMRQLRTQEAQLDQCGSCHARRARLVEAHGIERMHETWRPDLLTEDAYFVDGQIKDEVFEIGSFLQSKMAARGVTCTDCHDPHTARPRAEGNALCVRCHETERFDTPRHHFHEPSSEGAQCVNCHMPSRTYMVVHARRDHRIAVPRPDQSDALGTPNACATCHADRGNAWAAEAIRRHLAARADEPDGGPSTWSRRASLGPTLFAVRNDPSAAVAYVRALLDTAEAGPIAQATAVAALGRRPSPESLALIDEALRSDDPWLRLGGTQALATAPLPVRASRLLRLMSDPSRGVRLELAPIVAEVRADTLPEGPRLELRTLLSEYREWLSANGDRAGAMVSLANLERSSGDTDRARRALEVALRRDDAMLTASLNLADLYGAAGDGPRAEAILRRAVASYPDSADAHFALGLLLVRRHALGEATASLARATRLAPDDAHYAYVYAVALHSTGEVDRAVEVLRGAVDRFPESVEIRDALRSYRDEAAAGRRAR